MKSVELQTQAKYVPAVYNNSWPNEHIVVAVG